MRIQLSGLLLCIAVLGGCGGGASDAPELVPVSGTVTLDGKPLENAIVTFTSHAGQAASGRTNAEGKYTLHYQGDDGAPVGKYEVTIESALDAPAPPGYVDPIPARYNTKSELETVVDGDKEIPFDLKSK